MSNTTVFALAIGTAVARVIASGNTLGFSLLFPLAKPPSFAHASAAAGEARKVTNARIAGVSRKVTKRSPPTSTPLAPEPPVIVGNDVTLKPEFGFAFVDDRITPATKSPSSTIAAFGGVANAFVTDVLKSVWSAPDVPPAMSPLSPITCAIVFSAVITDGSVHLIL